MAVLYLDSNAIAKIYLTDERDRDVVFNALNAYDIVATSAITYAEVSGLLARALHGGRLPETLYQEALTALEQEWNWLEIQELSLGLSKLAAQLMKSHKGLRAMDALHLASALALRQSVSIKFLSFDTRLQDAAGKLMPEAI